MRRLDPRSLARRTLSVVALVAGLSAARAQAQPLIEPIGDRLARCWPDSAARAAARPSLALVVPDPPLRAGAARPSVTPRFATEAGARVARVAIERGTTLYGTGEVAGPLAPQWPHGRAWNTDAYGWSDGTPSLYQSHPWVLAVRADGTAFGVLADTPGRLVVDLTRGIEFRAQGPAFPLVIVERGSPAAW